VRVRKQDDLEMTRGKQQQMEKTVKELELNKMRQRELEERVRELAQDERK